MAPKLTVPTDNTSDPVSPLVEKEAVPLPPVEDNIEEDFMSRRREAVIGDMEESLRAFIDERDTEEAAPEEVDSKDPLGIRLDNSTFKMLSGASAAGSDIARGIVEAPAMFVSGTRDAVQEVLISLDSLGEWLNDNVLGEAPEFKLGDRVVEASKLEGAPDLPEGAEPDSVTGGLVKDMSQFVVAFIPFLRGIKAMSGGAAATKLGKVAQAEAAGGSTMAVAFDPLDKRLANLLEEHTELRGPVLEFLQSDPDSSEAKNRFVAAIEGIMIGTTVAVTGGFIRAVNAIRQNRAQRGMDKKASLVEPDEAIDIKFGDPDKPFITDEAAVSFLNKSGKPRKTKLPFKMNWAKLTGEKDIDESLETIAQLMKGTFNEARRGTITDDLLNKLARDLNLTPEEFLARQPGTAWPAEKILAAQFILDASLKETKRLGALAYNSTNEVDLFLFRKMFNIHTALQAQYQGAASEAGRALRALKTFGGSRQKQLGELQEMLMAEGGPDQVRRLAKAVSEIDDPQLFNKLANGSFGKRATDMVVEAWYFSLLSGPVTHVVNVSTSAMEMLWNIPKRSLAAQINKLRASEGVEVGEASAMFFGMINGFSNSIRMAGRTLVTGEQKEIVKGAVKRNKTEDRGAAAITGKNLFGKDYPEGSPMWFASQFFDAAGEYVFRLPRRALMVEDEFFKGQAMAMSVPATALRKGTQEGLTGSALAKRIAELERNPTQAMLQEGLELGESFTFLTPLGDTGKKFQAFVNKHPTMKFILPFIRTPVNLTKYAGSSTPLGLISKNLRNTISSGGPKGDLAVAQMVMGSGLAMVMADQALRGNVTGAGPSDAGLRETWLRTNQPFSIKSPTNVPGKMLEESLGVPSDIKAGDWISYNRTDPFGLLMGAAASYAEIAGSASHEDMAEIAVAIAMATSRSVFNKTWMRGPSDFLDAMTKPDVYGKRFIQNQIGTLLIPTLSAQLRQNLPEEFGGDDVWREVNSVIDAIKNRVPGYSKDLPAFTNVWGQDILLQGGLGPDIMSPYYKFGQVDRPIDEWLLSNEVDINMSPAIQGFSVGPGFSADLELTPHEHYRFKQLAGNEAKDPSTGLGLYDTLNAIINLEHPLSGAWLSATDGEEGSRAIIVKQQVTAFRALAKAELRLESMIGDNVLEERIRNRAINKSNALLIGP